MARILSMNTTTMKSLAEEDVAVLERDEGNQDTPLRARLERLQTTLHSLIVDASRRYNTHNSDKDIQWDWDGDPEWSMKLGEELFGSVSALSDVNASDANASDAPPPTASDSASVSDAILSTVTEIEQELEYLMQLLEPSSSPQTDEMLGQSAAAAAINSTNLKDEAESLNRQLQILRGCRHIQALMDECQEFSTGEAEAEADATLTSNNTPLTTSASSSSSLASPLPSPRFLMLRMQRVLQSQEHLQNIQQAMDSALTAVQTNTTHTNHQFIHSISDDDDHHRTGIAGEQRLDIIVKSLSDTVQEQRVLVQELALQCWQVELQAEMNAIVVSVSQITLEASYEVLEQLAPWKLDGLLRSFFRELWNRVLSKTLGISSSIAKAAVSASHSNRTQQSQSHSFKNFRNFRTSSHNEAGYRLAWTTMPESESESGDNNTVSPMMMKSVRIAWQAVLEFCVHRILLRRPSLLSSMGTYLFAKPNALPQSLDLTSLGIESKRLGDDHGLLLEPLLEWLHQQTTTNQIDSLPPAEIVPRLSATATRIESFVTPLVDFLVQLGLIHKNHHLPSSSSSSSIHDSSSNNNSSSCYAVEQLLGLPHAVPRLYVKQCRILILERARKYVKELDYHNTRCVQSDPFPDSMFTGPLRHEYARQLTPGLAVFQLPPCSISETAYELMILCRKTLDQAVAVAQHLLSNVASPDPVMQRELLALLPLALYTSTRETLDLFRLIIPVQYGYEIEHVPRTAAVFHNDCVYLAHHCLTLGLEYKNVFPPMIPTSTSTTTSTTLKDSKEEDDDDDDATANYSLLIQTCTFVDMVPMFRNLAEKSLGNMLEKHAKELTGRVSSRIPILGQALGADEILQEWSDAEDAVTQALFHLQHLHNSWTPILAPDILNRCIWYLADVVMALLLDAVQSSPDISYSACQFLHALFGEFSRGVLSMEKKEGNDYDSTKSTSASRVVDRFHAYMQFMDMSMSEIETALTEGVFLSVASPELSHLIMAAFDDSPERKHLLARLAKQHG